jgi:hypothetical protein
MLTSISMRLVLTVIRADVGGRECAGERAYEPIGVEGVQWGRVGAGKTQAGGVIVSPPSLSDFATSTQVLESCQS